MKDILDLVGRIFIAIIFLFEAYDTIAFFDLTKEKMTSYGLVWQQDALLIFSVCLLIFGGLFLMIGYRASFAAICLLIYFVPLTFTIHSFWNDPKDIQRIQSILFMKNIAIIGGLLMVLVNGSGRYSMRRLLATTRMKKR